MRRVEPVREHPNAGSHRTPAGVDVGFADEVHLREPIGGSGGSEPWVALLIVAVTATSLLTAWPALLGGLEPDVRSGAGFLAFLALMVAFPVGAAVLLVPSARRTGTAGAYLLLAAAGLAMALDPADGTAGFVWLVALRVVQGAAAALLLSAAGSRLGTGEGLSRTTASVLAVVGGLLGLVLGGLLAVASWRAAVLVPAALALGGLLASRSGTAAARVESSTASASTMRASASASASASAAVAGSGSRLGVAAAFLAALARGGLPLLLVVWLQALWFPLHDVDPDRTPLFAALFLVPLVVGVLIAAPISAALVAAGVRWLAPAGLVIAAAALLLLALLPINFAVASFVVILLLGGIGFGLAAAPVRAAAGVGRSGRGGPLVAAQSLGTVVSLVLLTGLLAAGVAASLGDGLQSRLQAAGATTPGSATSLTTPAALGATAVGATPLADVADDAQALTPDQSAFLGDPGLLPGILAEPLDDGLTAALGTAAVACLAAAVCSALAVRGRSTGLPSGAEAVGAVAPPPNVPVPPAPAEPTAPMPTPREEPPIPEPEPIPVPEPVASAERARSDLGGSAPVPAVAEPPPADAAVVPQPPSDEHDLVGTVRLQSGAPASASVTVTDLDGAELARTAVDDEGEFGIALSDAGPFLLVLTGLRIDSAAVLVDPARQAEPLELTVRSAAGVLRGRLHSADGPVGDGLVVLTTDGRPQARTTTNGDGSFVLADVPAGVHVLTTAAPDGEPRTQLVQMTRSGQLHVDVTVPVAQQPTVQQPFGQPPLAQPPSAQQAGGTSPVSS